MMPSYGSPSSASCCRRIYLRASPQRYLLECRPFRVALPLRFPQHPDHRQTLVRVLLQHCVHVDIQPAFAIAVHNQLHSSVAASRASAARLSPLPRMEPALHPPARQLIPLSRDASSSRKVSPSNLPAGRLGPRSARCFTKKVRPTLCVFSKGWANRLFGLTLLRQETAASEAAKGE